MSAAELQEEEIEVLGSIYEGDDSYKQIDSKTFQYKIGEDGNSKSFLVEVKWCDNYPNELPTITLEAFYNKHLIPEVKSHIVAKLIEECEPLLESAMTYSIFEFAKENADELLSEQPDSHVQISEPKITTEPTPQQKPKEKVKKEQLSKAQKRKIVNRLDAKGELPRGHDWVDIVRHLSQTGSAPVETKS